MIKNVLGKEVVVKINKAITAMKLVISYDVSEFSFVFSLEYIPEQT